MIARKNQQNQAPNGSGMFLILTFVFLSISIWQTARGYQLMFGKELAWVFSLAIGLMMLFLSFEMRKRRLKGQNAMGPLIGYIACAIFCFFGNFNAIYSRYNREELFKKELEKHRQQLTAISTAAITALGKADTSAAHLQSKVQELKGQLLMQIKDPANSGLGIRAKEIILAIENNLGQKLTVFSGSPAQLAGSYTDNIDHILTARLANSRKKSADQMITEMIIQKDTLDAMIMTALKPQNISSMGQDAIFKTVDAINNIGEKTKNFLGVAQFSYVPAEFENQEIGKISHTFASAFNGENWVTALISMLVAIAIDALVPFVVFVGTQPEEENFQYSNKRERDIQVL